MVFEAATDKALGIDTFESGSFQDIKRYFKEDLFGIKEPKIAPPAKERAAAPTHIKPEIALAISDYEARRRARQGRAATRVTMPSSLMEPVTSRPELKDRIG